LNLEYKHDLFWADSKIKRTQGNSSLDINSSILAAMNDVTFGGSVKSTLDAQSGSSSVKDWEFGAGYGHGKFRVVATTSGLTSHTVWGSYRCSSQFQCATELTCKPGDKVWSTALGGAYQCNKDNTFKAKITKTNDSLNIDLAHKSTIKKGTDVSGAIGYDVVKSKPTYGFTVTLA
jgi:hypothetical protein